MCWYHLIYNVKKHESLTKVSKEIAEMMIVDLTKLHYCLSYDFEPFKSIFIEKWNSIPEWFEGTFSKRDPIVPRKNAPALSV